ncbi:hypothetical protein [Helicobacter trogontum]|uniref:Outer membrane beta-barrel protein n=1 Tax=Helicobacter trogontum TaxID=50960 RepID=A0A4U8SCH7_9HELI|nr:hypothetical protein [Helicobacter trogontum]TLD83721.1 hypothetical protein LS81_004035 [Helicobacter trogontum]
MKRIYFAYIVLFLQSLFADSIDNALLESLKEDREKVEREKYSKQEHEVVKPNSIKPKSTQDDIKYRNNSKPHVIKSHLRSPFRYHLIQNSAIKEIQPYKKMTWFIGVGVESHTLSIFGNRTTQTNNTSTLNTNLSVLSAGIQVGFFARFSPNQGLKFAVIGDYNLFSASEFYSLGGAIDYFYNVALEGRFLTGIGVFLGASALMPLHIYDTANIIARIGLGANTKKYRIEVYGGYPISYISGVDRFVAVGFNMHFLL